MTRMLLSPPLASFIVLASALIALGILLGSPLYVPGAYAAELVETPDCIFPCWKGIIPGQTRRAPVHAYLNTAGYSVENPMVSIGTATGLVYRNPTPSRCAVKLTFNDNLVDSVRLMGCPTMTLGEVMLIFGLPQRATFYGGRLSFQREGVMVETDAACTQRLTPDTPIVAVIFTRTRLEPVDGVTNEMSWSGFKHRQYYTPDRAAYSRFVRCAIY